jgi:hypothetical protein
MNLFIKITFLSFVLVACVSRQKSMAGGYYNYKTECMGSELDGSVTLRSWGTGRNYFDASDQAKKNALRDIIFKGIGDGSEGCDKMPLIIEPGAVQTYEVYFAKFFGDGGKYNEFVNLKDERIDDKLDRDKKIGEGTRTYSVILRIKKLELKQRLKLDGIIKY